MEIESTAESRQLAESVTKQLHALLRAARIFTSGDITFSGHPDDGYEFVVQGDENTACYVNVYPAGE